MPNAKHHHALNILLHNLRKECIALNPEQAGNTILDIRQEWSYLDATMKRNANYFPSDSIKTLDSLVTQLSADQEDILALRSILKEIKRVNEKLDYLNE